MMVWSVECGWMCCLGVAAGGGCRREEKSGRRFGFYARGCLSVVNRTVGECCKIVNSPEQ